MHVDVIEVAVDRTGRPGGQRFGSLVHAVLAVVELDADDEAVRRVAVAQGRLLGASDEEVNAAARAAARALAHPVLRRAAACGQRGDLRRETPLLFEREDGSLAEGVVDLAFREADGWTVVDFKTDRDVAAQRAVYAAQVGLYAEGIALATGDPARGLLLVV